MLDCIVWLQIQKKDVKMLYYNFSYANVSKMLRHIYYYFITYFCSMLKNLPASKYQAIKKMDTDLQNK